MVQLDYTLYLENQSCSSNEESSTSYLKDQDFDDNDWSIADCSTELLSNRQVFAEDLRLKTYEYISTLVPSDVHQVIGDRLQEMIFFACTNSTMIGLQFIIENYFDVSAYRTVEEKSLLFTIEVVLKAAAVYYRSILPIFIFDSFNTVEELLNDYDAFREGIDLFEQQKLLTFRNMMKIALSIIPAKGNKRLLMCICSLLEGSSKLYASGGARSYSTSRRVLIFEKESNTLPLRRHCADSTPFQQQKTRAKRLITCDCGAKILARTIWKHKKSKKHSSFMRKGTVPCWQPN